MRWLIVVGSIAMAVAFGAWLFQSSDWQNEHHADLASAASLSARGALPPGLPEGSRDIAVSYNDVTGEAFLRLSLPPASAGAFRTGLIPVGRATGVALAMRHPDRLEGWEEVTLAARLRTGALQPRRPRDGSRWYLIVQDDGQVWGWNAPDIAPAPAGG